MSPEYSHGSPPLDGCGVIYAVTGEKFFKEARTSIRSIRALHPDLPITVCYSWEGALLRELLAGIAHINYLDLTTVVSQTGLKMSDGMERSRGVKINTIKYSPYDYTLFLDSDTYIKKPLNIIFDTLKEGETQIITTNEPIASYAADQYAHLGDADRPNAGGLISLSNPSYFNSGVFAFRASVREFGVGDLWVDTFIKQSKAPASSNWGRLCDQSALNKTLNFVKDVPRKMLPNTIWNAQCKILNELYKQGLWDEIHIIHCKMVHAIGCDPEKLIKTDYIKKFSLVD